MIRKAVPRNKLEKLKHCIKNKIVAITEKKIISENHIDIPVPQRHFQMKLQLVLIILLISQ